MQRKPSGVVAIALMMGAKLVIGLGIFILMTNVGACWDDGPTVIDPERPATLVLSDTAAPTSSLSTARASLSDSASFGSGATYVSLAAGTIPNGMIAVIRNRRTESSVTAPMTNGGLDPVRVVASAGDTLETTVEVSGAAPTTFVNVVPARRRPTVVRTIPARRKTDVPLNARITIVFSEPVDSRTISSMSVRLVRGSTSVPVQVNLVDGAGLSIELTPAASLAVGTTYQIVVSQDVRDLDGDELEAPFASEFTTGSAVAVASIATAQTALFTASNGQLRTFEMSAMLDQDGDVTGRFSIFYPGTGGRSGGRVTCFAIRDGRTAWVAGVVEDAGNPELIGQVFGWRVVDNGHPDRGAPDQLSFAHTIGTSPEIGEGFCASTPTIDPNQEEIALHELMSGNIVVASEGDPPLPPPPTTSMSRIAFAAFPNGGIRVMRADGLGSRTLTDAPGDWNPAWSPDGSRIAFDRNSGSSSRADIYIMNADGTGLRPLTGGDWFDARPAWSPDGRKIAFYRDGAINVMNGDGSGVTKLTDGGAYPSWSPDGSSIAFWSGQSGSRAVYVMNADGSGRTQITNDTLNASNPSWSPDGQSIAFQGEGGIFISSADGSNVVRIALNGQTPVWSPDSRMILYEWFGLNVISIDGGGMTRRGSGFTPAWSPMGTVPPAPQPFVSLQLAGGDAQTDTVLATLPEPLSVRLVRDDGTPVSGISVSWRLAGTSAAVRPALSRVASISNADGIASASLTLGSATGAVTAYALVSDGTARSIGVEFRATAKAGAPVMLERYGPDSSLSTVNSTLAYWVYARDGHGSCPTCGNLVTGLPISWSVTSGGGALTPTLDTTATDSLSDGYPLSRVVHEVGPNEGTVTVTAIAHTIAGAPQMTFTTIVVTEIVEVAWGGFTPDTVTTASGKTVAWRWNPGGDSDDVHAVVFEDDPTEPVSSPTNYYGFHKRLFGGSARTVRYRCPLHSTSYTEGEIGVVIVR